MTFPALFIKKNSISCENFQNLDLGWHWLTILLLISFTIFRFRPTLTFDTPHLAILLASMRKVLTSLDQKQPKKQHSLFSTVSWTVFISNYIHFLIYCNCGSGYFTFRNFSMWPYKNKLSSNFEYLLFDVNRY